MYSVGPLCPRDRPLATHNIHVRNIHVTVHIRTRITRTKLRQTYALDRATTGISDCGVTSLKLTNWEGKFDSEMNSAIDLRKAMYVHIIRVQLSFL